jgi:23S rRNA (adenine2503-C2)-methyltransferase
MGCGFCASGLDGVVRDLTAWEILEQVRWLGHRTGRRISHVVFMGMGEPLANFDATVEAVRALIDPDRMGLSARHMTVSTVGLPGRIRDLAALELPITLAISLHAPSDELRRELIPAARGASIEEIIEAARVFFASRGREVTLEYVLLGGVNDSPAQADALADIAHRLRCNVNLIRYNPVASLGFERPLKQDVDTFARRLDRRGVNVQIRRSRGVEADAACGQLRRRREDLASRPGTRDHRQET